MKKKILEVLREIEAGLLVKEDLNQAAEKTISYLKELRKWNRLVNLTAENNEASILEQHFYDSLQYAQAMVNEGETIDIGSGAGFPGIPLKILFPGLKITLLESQRKKANFLKSTLRILALQKVEVIHDRAENLKEDKVFQNRFQHALFRAVADQKPSLVMGAPLIKEGGKVITKKSMKEREIAFENLPLVQEIPIKSFSGAKSKLMVFKKCFT